MIKSRSVPLARSTQVPRRRRCFSVGWALWASPCFPRCLFRRATGGGDQHAPAARMPAFVRRTSASARRLDQHREPVPGQQAPYGCARVEAFCEAENRSPVTLPYGPF